MGWAQQLLSSLRHPSFLFRHRHNTPFSSSPTVCQCPSPDHTAHCLHFKDLRAINTRWWQLTPHNHQGRDNNFFVQNHLCSELLSRCQWLSSSFHALRCGLYVAPALALSDCICHFMPSSSTLPAQGLPNQFKIQKYEIHNTILKTVPLLYLAVFVISCILLPHFLQRVFTTKNFWLSSSILKRDKPTVLISVWWHHYLQHICRYICILTLLILIALQGCISWYIHGMELIMRDLPYAASSQDRK